MVTVETRDEKIARLINEGLTFRQVGSHLNISGERVRQIANRLGIEGRRSRKAAASRRAAALTAPASQLAGNRTASKTNLSLNRLRELLVYDQHTGFWRWINPKGRARSKEFAGSLHDDGYIQIRIDRELYMAHVLAWFYVHERWPENMIDHENMNKADNRISNLRQATASQNFGNSNKKWQNTSGNKGVYFDPCSGKWRAEIAHIKLGRFDSKDAAVEAYAIAAKLRFGEFART